MALQEVHVPALDPQRLGAVIGELAAEQFVTQATALARDGLGTASVLNVNSTATGGGVAEMLHVLIPYARGAGLDARWLVIDGDAEFFAITKRIHNHIYGEAGDGGPLGEAEHAHYQQVLDANAIELAGVVRPGDVVILHDPQTAGLVRSMRAHGAVVVWRCHIGIDHPNRYNEEGWQFLRRYLEPPAAGAYVFSRRSFAPPWLPDELVHVIPPSIDPFSPKNMPLRDDEACRILAAIGLIADGPDGPATFTRTDGSAGRIDRVADLVGSGPRPGPDVRLVTQVSRWDRLKDMTGVMQGFARVAAADHRAHLVLAGPSVEGVADDPEGAEVLDECWRCWRDLPPPARARITLACLPMADVEENAVMVNALQRHSAIVVQKSLAEGFGLTVAEAMYKGTPVIGSAVGGISDQIVDGESGVLVRVPTDLASFGDAVLDLLGAPDRLASMGDAARERVIEEFLPDRHLRRWVELLASLRG